MYSFRICFMRAARILKFLCCSLMVLVESSSNTSFCLSSMLEISRSWNSLRTSCLVSSGSISKYHSCPSSSIFEKLYSGNSSFFVSMLALTSQEYLKTSMMDGSITTGMSRSPKILLQVSNARI